MRTFLRSAVALAGGAVAAAVLAAPPAANAPAGASSAQAAGAPSLLPRILTVAMGGGYWPLHEQDGTYGRQGLEADLAQDLARLLGFERAQFVSRADTDLGAVEAVAAGKADVAISSITPTDERRKLVDFTKPYVVLHYRLAVRKGSPPSSLDPSGKRIAVPTGPAVAVARAKLPGATVIEVPSPDAAAQALLSGKADLFMAEDVGVVLAIAARPLEVVGPPLAESPLAVAVPKGQGRRYDDALATLHGRIDEMIRRYRPGVAPELPRVLYLKFTGGVDEGFVRIDAEPFQVSAGDAPEDPVAWVPVGSDEVFVGVPRAETRGDVEPAAPAPGRVVAKPPADVLRRVKGRFAVPEARWLMLVDGTYVGFGSRSVETGQQCGSEEGDESYPCTDLRYEVVVVRGESVKTASFAVSGST